MARYFKQLAAAQKRKLAQLEEIEKAARAAYRPSSDPITGTSAPAGQGILRRLPAAVEQLAAVAQVTGTPAAERTLRNVRKQLQAFQAVEVTSFEIQPMPHRGATDLKVQRYRICDAAGVEKSIGWLRRMNLLGYDIYIRPAERRDGMAAPLAFIDDMSAEKVREIECAGIRFAILTESSEGNFQGWARISDRLVTQAELSACGKVLAQRFGTDTGATDWRRHGRLSGFTNRKPIRRTEKGAPFALMRKSGIEISPLGEEILAEARAMLVAEKQAKRSAEKRQESVRTFGSERALGNAAAEFHAAWNRSGQMSKDDPSRPDTSARDFSACLALRARGFDEAAVKAAMREARPEADQYAYIDRTVERAFAMAYDRDSHLPVYRPSYRPRGKVDGKGHR